jgi:hypothetical protein
MDFTEYKNIILNRFEHCKKLLIEKGEAYARNGNPHHVFESVAHRKGITELEALDGMLEKHLQSFYDIILDIKTGKHIAQKVLDEKISDIINYFSIAETIIVCFNNKLTVKDFTFDKWLVAQYQWSVTGWTKRGDTALAPKVYQTEELYGRWFDFIKQNNDRASTTTTS